MVETRLQSNRNILIEIETMTDRESNHSISEMPSRDQMIDIW